jgi:hypothetical protein
MTGDAKMANELLIVRLEQRFHRAAFAEHRLNFGHRAQIVQLPTSLTELQRGEASVSAVFSRKAAAAKISVSEDTIDQRALEWQHEPAPGRIRLKRLKLGEDTRQERRYFEPDVEALLKGRLSETSLDGSSLVGTIAYRLVLFEF